jgi:hypothetical protein
LSAKREFKAVNALFYPVVNGFLPFLFKAERGIRGGVFRTVFVGFGRRRFGKLNRIVDNDSILKINRRTAI